MVWCAGVLGSEDILVSRSCCAVDAAQKTHFYLQRRILLRLDKLSRSTDVDTLGRDGAFLLKIDALHIRRFARRWFQWSLIVGPRLRNIFRELKMSRQERLRSGTYVSILVFAPSCVFSECTWPCAHPPPTVYFVA